MSQVEFQAWPKTPRLNRDCIVTEKIDGTNAAVGILEDGFVYAQSRKRIISLDSDNAGFARWVHENSEALFTALGPGLHFGEWWGQGIQRRYGQDHKRFSLFNVLRYAEADLSALPNVDLVPVLYDGPFTTEIVNGIVQELREGGSVVAPGQPAEGVIVFHKAAGTVFKVLCENDALPKGVAEAA